MDPVIFQKGLLLSIKYFQILLINTILTIMKIFEENLHMKIFGECEDRTLDHQIGSRTSNPLGHAAISYEAGFQAIYSQHWIHVTMQHD